jgi:hypothetical protein
MRAGNAQGKKYGVRASLNWLAQENVAKGMAHFHHSKLLVDKQCQGTTGQYEKKYPKCVLATVIGAFDTRLQCHHVQDPKG